MIRGDTQVEKLLLLKADPNLANVLGNTPLMVSASEGHSNVVDALLKAGASFDLQSKGCSYHPEPGLGGESKLGDTALILAAFSGHSTICRKLAECGADYTLLDSSRRSALHYDDADGRIFASVDAGRARFLQRLRVHLNLHLPPELIELVLLHFPQASPPVKVPFSPKRFQSVSDAKDTVVTYEEEDPDSEEEEDCITS